MVFTSIEELAEGVAYDFISVLLQYSACIMHIEALLHSLGLARLPYSVAH